MDKYEVFVKVANEPRSMFRIRANDISEIIEEVNERYTNIIECTACRMTENNDRVQTVLNVSEGKVII